MATKWADGEELARWALVTGAIVDPVRLGKMVDAYARQQVEAFRERLMPFVIHRVSCPQAGRNYLPDKFFDANIAKCTCGLAAAIRVLASSPT